MTKGLTEYPRISIVTPSLNQGCFLEEAIRSVLLQRYPNLEYIVVDGGSTDESVEIIRRYASWLDYWVSESDRGQSHALNKGFARASGTIFGWLNSDDMLQPGALHEVARLWAEAPDAAAWIGAWTIINAEGHPIEEGVPKVGTKTDMARWFRAAKFFQPACFFSRACFQQVGGLDERLHVVMDMDLWIRLWEKGRFVISSQNLALVRMYEGIKSWRDPIAREAEVVYVCLKNGEVEAACERMQAFARDAAPSASYVVARIPLIVLLRHVIKRFFLLRW
ncbi:MAG: glycosyltransferase family 2 protein [Kiritimatiellia bacterium]